ncbi:hypothetical protein HZS_321, partial [Henneguya salminicola]
MKCPEILNQCKTILLDCDGVIWRGGELITKADIAVKRLRTNGYSVAFVTNNSRITRSDFHAKLTHYGFEPSQNECFCTSFLTAIYLKSIKFEKSVYVIGTEGLAKELNLHGFITHRTSEDNSGVVDDEIIINQIENVGAVVVGLDPRFNYVKLTHAMNYLKEPTMEFIATNTDAGLPVSRGHCLPGAGSMIAAVKTASGRDPVVMGKPSTRMFSLMTEILSLDPSKTCIVGDRIETDILFGHNCGLKTALVYSGITTRDDYINIKQKYDR